MRIKSFNVSISHHFTHSYVSAEHIPSNILTLVLRVRVWVLRHSVVSDFLRPHELKSHQAPLSMEFPRQEHWSVLPFPTSRDLPDPGIEPRSAALAGRFCTTEHLRSPVLRVASIYWAFTMFQTLY